MSQLLTALVRRYSPSHHERPAVDELVGWMTAHGFRAHVDAVGNAVGEIGAHDAAHTLMLLGHIDTFPVDLPVEERDGALYGRGTVDAKGPLCAFAEAAAAASIPDGWRVVVIGAVEEEAATSKGARYVREHYTPDWCIIGEPSGATRVTLGYKGRIVFDYALTRPMAHTARPEPSVAALGAAFWTRIEAWCAQQNAGIESAFEQVWAHLRSINTTTDHLSETARLSVSMRLPPRLGPDDVLAAVRGLSDEGGEFNTYGHERAVQSDRNSPLVRALLAAIRAGGDKPGFVLKTGTADMNVVAETWDCPIVAYGPGDSNLDHTPNEHIMLAEYQRAVGVLTHVIQGLPTSSVSE
ncbi:MAG: [LysW]-lysine hydrolase [Pleurocapsa minor GSE-CHR-MK-17-07R]|jgi:LysW-gamma-L-lysine carboxypeptidase|nr:[LysW]-lysine hydrolase [Pleurocapsa minor GSE-CHR-MK 17-07R]